MRKICFGLIGIILLSGAPSMLFGLELSTVQTAIEQSGARWQAGPQDPANPKSLGLLPNEREIRGHALNELSVPSASFVPSHFDWRNVDGKNFVTPVRDQGYCGGCWAFSAVAALESLALITLNTPGIDLDLSEQTLISCSVAGSCAGGYLDRVANALSKTGTPKEVCLPYRAHDSPCAFLCSDGLGFNSSYRIQNWVNISEDSAPDIYVLKSMLISLGPLCVGLQVYEDFRYHYQGGIYTYVSGACLGGHAVLLVGYDDHDGCFIAKNSWTSAWGENGYFRIAYSQIYNEVAFGNRAIGILGLVAPENSIYPEITANDRQSLSITPQTPISVAVSLDPLNQPQAGAVDWWIWRTGPDGMFGYDPETKAWRKDRLPIRLPIFRLPPYEIWNGTLPTPGSYSFYFAIDENDDGVFDGSWQEQLDIRIK